MSNFVIKIIAFVAMLLDHIKYSDSVFENFATLYLGRLSYPLFAFLLVEGYVHTSNLKKYFERLVVFGIISQIPFMLFRTLVGEWVMLNIMFTLLLGLLCITAYDKIKNKYISISLVITLITIGEILRVDYGWFGVTTIFIMYLLREKKMFLPLAYGIIVLVFYYSLVGLSDMFSKEYMLQMLFMWLSTFIINAYNGEKGKSLKYFFYSFYPIHMMIVYLLHFLF